MAPPKYIDEPNKRCIIEKYDFDGHPCSYEITVNDTIASMGGICIEPMSGKIWRTMMQAHTKDVKMNWHADGNFHISGVDLPCRSDNPFVSSSKRIHGVFFDSLNNNPEVFLQMLGWIHISRSEVFLRPQNRIEKSRSMHEKTVSLGSLTRPQGIFICRVRTVSGMMVDPKVIDGIDRPELRGALVKLIRSPIFGGLTEDCVNLVEGEARMAAVQGETNRKSYFLFYMCPLIEIRVPKRIWFISSVMGDDEVVLSLTVKPKSDWWPG